MSNLKVYNIVCLVVYALEESITSTADSFQGTITMYLKYFNCDSHVLQNKGKFLSLI